MGLRTYKILILMIIMTLMISACTHPNSQASAKNNQKSSNKYQNSLFPLRGRTIKAFEYSERIDFTKVIEAEGNYAFLSFFDGAVPVERNTFKVYGWAYSDTKKIEYLLIADSKGVMKGAALPGKERVGLPEAIGKKNALYAGWEGHVKIESVGEELFVYAKIRNEPYYVALKTSYLISGDKFNFILTKGNRIADYQYGKKIDMSQIKSPEGDYQIIGFFDGGQPKGYNGYKVFGWAYSSGKPIEYVLITNDSGEMRGTALAGIERPGLSEVIGKADALHSGWEGFAKIKGKEEQLKAYAKIKGEPYYVPIGNFVTLQGHTTAK